MGDGNSLVNFGDLTKPATVLIEKIAEATGAVFQPYQIKRVAKAEAEADKIKAIANIEITELQQRGLQRFINEQARQQENIESITAQTILELTDGAKPEEIEDDWLAKFFNECKLVSDKDMQSLWAKLLAGQANRPGTFSKRTIEFVSNLDKSDAQLFTNLCCFCWFSGEILPIVYDAEHEIYGRKVINFGTLTHLDAIGLIRFEALGGFNFQKLSKAITLNYYGAPINIEFAKEENNTLEIGKVLLTKTGKELAPICGSKKSEEFMDYIVSEWHKKGYLISCPLSQKADTA